MPDQYCRVPTRSELRGCFEWRGPLVRDGIPAFQEKDSLDNLQALLKPVEPMELVSNLIAMPRETYDRFLAIEKVALAILEDAKGAFEVAEDIEHDGLFGVTFELLKKLKEEAE